MRRKGKLYIVLSVIAAILIMRIPVSEADATSSASDFKMDGSVLTKYTGEQETVKIPSDVEVIGEGAFEGNDKVKKITLPAGVQQIEEYAFWDCTNLETVELGTGITEITDFSFANCKGLKSIVLPTSVRRIGIQAFANCVNLTDITIPPEVVSIHDTSFDGCFRLNIHSTAGTVAAAYAETFAEKQKEMPEYEDVEDYNGGEDTEDGSSDGSLEDSSGSQPDKEQSDEAGTLLGSTQVVGNRAVVFVDNSHSVVQDGGEADASAQGTVIGGEVSEQDGQLPKYAIVDGKVVADQAYYRNQELTAVKIPEGIEEIGQFAFARSSIEQVNVPDGVKTIGYGAFYHCDSLRQVTLPDSIECVEPQAFTYTKWMESFLSGKTDSDFLIAGNVLIAYRGNDSVVTIPEEVSVIGAEVFQNHSEIRQVICPGDLTVIGEAAFSGCKQLKDVILGDKVTKIKDRAFADSGLRTITLPESLQEEGLLVFPSGAEVVYEGNLPADSYENTASRLSNAAYRGRTQDNTSQTQEPKVTVTGSVPRAQAELEGAADSYELQIKNGGKEAFAQAYERIYGEKLPEDITVYELELTDDSGVPITKLGRQTLKLQLPLPEQFLNQEVQVFTLDRNGQLEYAEADFEGQMISIETDYISQIGICTR